MSEDDPLNRLRSLVRELEDEIWAMHRRDVQNRPTDETQATHTASEIMDAISYRGSSPTDPTQTTESVQNRQDLSGLISLLGLMRSGEKLVFDSLGYGEIYASIQTNPPDGFTFAGSPDCAVSRLFDFMQARVGDPDDS